MCKHWYVFLSNTNDLHIDIWPNNGSYDCSFDFSSSRRDLSLNNHEVWFAFKQRYQIKHWNNFNGPSLILIIDEPLYGLK